MTLPDGSEDTVVITGKDEEDIRLGAIVEVIARFGTDPWSELLDDGPVEDQADAGVG